MITCRLSEDPRPPETIGTLVVNTMITDADRLPKKERDILRPNIGVVMLLLQTLYTVVMVGHRPHLLPFLMIGMTDGVGSVMEIIRPLPLHLGLGLHLAGEMTLKDCLQGKLLAVWSLAEAKNWPLYRDYVDYRGRPPSPHRYSDFNRPAEPPARFR